ncbi:MAG TPA: VOC family protein [Acidimicrobiia bacterium]|nr:VOC family protein [Acidimicrobiia bacterium]
MLRFDHAILTVADLDGAAQRLLDEHGLDSVPGGRHAGHGTANRLVPLGHDYVELVAVVDPTEAAESPFGRWVGMHAVGDRPAGICLRTTDIVGLGRRLDLAPVRMSRVRPDGVELSWRLLGLEVALGAGLPFFIEWDVHPGDYPGRSGAAHLVNPRGISWVELGGDAERLDGWLGAHDLDLRIVDGSPGVHRVGIDTDAGVVVL